MISLSSVMTFGFNTWAREEPNPALAINVYGNVEFQYLGSRGAQRLYV